MDGIKRGASQQEIERELDSIYREGGWDDDFDPWRIAATVRTNVMQVFNEGRAQAFREMGDEVEAYQASAILDSRTSEICLLLDGKIFPAKDLDLWNPPYQHQCRTVLVGILKGEEWEPSEMPAVRRLPGGFLEPA